jgi:hypothetical protein
MSPNQKGMGRGRIIRREKLISTSLSREPEGRKPSRNADRRSLLVGHLLAMMSRVKLHEAHVVLHSNDAKDGR